MKSKILQFKILQRIIRKFPDKQYNRQNSVLLHETIPLKKGLRISYHQPYGAETAVEEFIYFAGCPTFQKNFETNISANIEKHYYQLSSS
jgi:hypothetical protein